MSKLKGKWSADNWVQEVPSGTVNSSNVTFTLGFTPKATTLELKLDCRPLYSGTDYTLSGTTITMTVAPAFGQQLDASYQKRT